MKYKIEQLRDTKLSEEEYKIFILVYPIYLIAISDGSFDEDEKKFIETILYNFLNPLYGENLTHEQYENLIENYILDFQELYHLNDLKEEMLLEFTKFDSEVKKAILDLIIEVAEVSNGFSEMEKIEFEHIKKYV